MGKLFKVLFYRNTTFEYCNKCVLFSNNLSQLCYKKRFKYLRLKFWKFQLDKLKLNREGICNIAIITNEGEHTFATCKARDKCLWKETDVTSEIEYIKYKKK